MKGKIIRSWAKWHVYLSCFFLPLLLLYTTTGALYLIDIRGSNASSTEVQLTFTSWPTDELQARAFLEQYYDPQQYGALPTDYYHRPDMHNWYGFHSEVILSLDTQPNTATLSVQQHGFWKKLVLIHKGHAGQFFVILGILVGIGLLISLITGVVLAINHNKYRRTGSIAMFSGLLTLCICYWLS